MDQRGNQKENHICNIYGYGEKMESQHIKNYGIQQDTSKMVVYTNKWIHQDQNAQSNFIS